MTKIIVPADELKIGLDAVWHAIATDEMRPVLTAVLFEEHGDVLRLVAADNYRIAMYDVEVLERSTPEPFAGRVMLARGDAQLLRSALAPIRSTVTLSVVNDRLRVDWTRGAVEFRLMDGTYPDYAQVLRPKSPPSVSLNPVLLAESAAAFHKAKAITLDVEIAGPLEPVVIRAADCPLVTVVMPVRTSYGKHDEPAEAAS